MYGVGIDLGIGTNIGIDIGMAVSVNRGSPLVGVLIMRALLFGVYLRAPDFWKTPSVGIHIGIGIDIGVGIDMSVR